MNGHTRSNGDGGTNQNSSAAQLAQLQEALSIVHGPYSSNDLRRQASEYLENFKANDEAPYHGFTLASDSIQPPVVRHYALSLLEHAIRHRWAGYDESQAKALREWVIQLSQRISAEDPIFLRNKTAQLWVDIAKRCWGSEWPNMDELLFQIWDQPGAGVYKEFVLFVLETLSDDIFNSDDTVAILREGVLSKACVDCFTPLATLSALFPSREINDLRYGEEGWIVRVGLVLRECVLGDVKGNERLRIVATKALAYYRSVLMWAIPQAIADGSCVEYMVNGLGCSSVPVQLVRS